MAEHTPGPWHWGRGGRYNLFAGHSTPILYASSHDGSLEISDADARLITAAPDLLEALRDTLGGLDAEFGARVTDVNFPKLRAALRKAAP